MRPFARLIDSRLAAAAALGFALGTAVSATASAQATPPAATQLPASPSNAVSPDVRDDLRLRQQELESVRTQQRQAAETEARLRQEIESIGEDRRKLNQALIDAASRLRAAEARVTESETRLRPLDESERALRRSLEERRTTIAEVLAALQRIGRLPPPAILVSPEDALRSVRTAILLGAVLPEFRVKAEALAADLEDLLRVRKGIAEEHQKLQRDAAVIAEERQRLALLVDERQKKQTDTERALDSERQRAVALARQVDNLKDLIARAEQSMERANRAALQAQQAPKPPDDEKARDNKDSRSNLAALKDPGRLAPAIAFAAARGHLPLPVNGVRVKEFGGSDNLGGTERGLSIATRSGAQVTSPCDGWVVYAAPFRNYGQVLILNAGGGYHVVLAGMERISVEVGQFVLTGEPIAAMGSGLQAAAPLAQGSSQPVLYVEFRKDGTPVDPSPWWAASEGEKVRG